MAGPSDGSPPRCASRRHDPPVAAAIFDDIHLVVALSDVREDAVAEEAQTLWTTRQTTAWESAQGRMMPRMVQANNFYISSLLICKLPHLLERKFVMYSV
jgi:hypothetical protein